MDGNPLDRREFISKAGQYAILAGLILPITRSAATAIAGAKPAPLEPISLDLEKPEYHALKQVGGAMKIPDPSDKKKPIIVIRSSETQVTAFSSKCTHWGCEVPLPVDGSILCPCHGSIFDANGKVTHGPAKKDLFAYSANLDKTIITIQENSR